MALLEQISWPKPLQELLEPAFETYRGVHPWLPEDALAPKSIVRQMWTEAMSFTDFVSRYQIARSEGLVLRYLTDAYRTLQHSVPAEFTDEEFERIVDWLGETVRQTDSSLLDEWEALADPEHADAERLHDAPPPPRALSEQRVFEVMIRNGMWARVDAVSRDDLDTLVRLDNAAAHRTDPAAEVPMSRKNWDDALEEYYTEHDRLLVDADARNPHLLTIQRTGRIWEVRQTLHDPEGHHDWVIDAFVDANGSDEVGELVLVSQQMHRL